MPKPAGNEAASSRNVCLVAVRAARGSVYSTDAFTDALSTRTPWMTEAYDPFALTVSPLVETGDVSSSSAKVATAQPRSRKEKREEGRIFYKEEEQQ